MTSRLLVAAVLVLTQFSILRAAEPARPAWDLTRLAETPPTYPAEGFQAASPQIRPLFFEGLPYRGKPTRVFAWLGIPQTQAGQRVPGMVLVHGGGGTAFHDWVKLWVERGYAAISMDTCGALPEPADARPRPRHEFSGPPGWGGFDQIDDPPPDQWTYHAVADAILAHSLLRSQPEVDPDRIGLTGISWGGYLTCVIAGVDNRFRFAAPVYGCGHYLDTVFAKQVETAGDDHGVRWLQWWDPANYLPNARMPTLWVTGSNDFAYWFPALQKSYRLVPAEQRTLCIRLRMPHGHGAAGEAPPEIAVFADSLLNKGCPLPRIVSATVQDSTVTVTFQSERPIAKAELNFTSDNTRPWPEREWSAIPAEVTGDRAVATLPSEARAYYMNLFDDRGCVVSSEHAER